MPKTYDEASCKAGKTIFSGGGSTSDYPEQWPEEMLEADLENNI